MKIESHRPSPFHHFSPITALLAFAFMATTLTLSACGDPPPPPMPSEFEFPLEVFVYDQNDTPIARIPVLVDGQVVGYTDKNGAFAARILEAPNTQIELSLGDLTGFRFTSDNMMQETLTVRQGVGGELVGLPLTLRSSVHSLKNSYLAWVQLNCDDSLKEDACENIPVKLDGKVITRTDKDGKAHFAFDGIIGKKSIVTVDTPVFQKDSEYYAVFEPKQPAFELNLGIDHTVFIIEENFTDLIGLSTERVVEKAKKPARARPVARKAAPAQKTAVKKAPAKKAPAQKAPPKKAEPKNSVINLF